LIRRPAVMNAASSQRRLRALFVGDFSASRLGNQSVVEDLVGRLRAHDVSAVTTSNRLRKLARVTDMLVATWRHRHAIDVASVDVFSGNAFVWAESVCFLLKRSRVHRVRDHQRGGQVGLQLLTQVARPGGHPVALPG
jgi:hypothetical protein